MTDDKNLKVFWFRKPRPGNFGDILTPLIFEHYGYNAIHAMQEEADYLMVGSIAKIATSRHTVLGSGVMTASPQLCPDANWRWVRGPRTRKAVLENGGSCPETYGDPAMLLPRMMAPAPQKKYKVGITPHYVNYEQVKEQYPEHRVINLLNADPRQVVEEITECEKIISSSLHGIIAAHAYGIPAAWVKFEKNLSGDDTKFHDHYESLGMSAELSTIDRPIFKLSIFDDKEIHEIMAQGDFR